MKRFAGARVKLLGYTRGSDEFSYLGPEDITAYAAHGDFSKEASYKLILKDKKRGDLGKKNKTIIKESYGRGHGSVGDIAHFTFSVEGLTRAATLQFTGPYFLEHEQQSLRRARIGDFYIPKDIRESNLYNKLDNTLDDITKFYDEMLKDGIPKEDARFCVPLLTITNITTTGNVRELQHLHVMNKQGEVPSYVKNVVNNMIKKARKVAPNLFKKYKSNYELLAWYPSTQIFSSENKTINKLIKKYTSKASKSEPILLAHSSIDIGKEEIEDAIRNRNEAELANLKHVNFEFLVDGSIAMNHQLRRQRTMDLSDESIYDAAKRREIITPPKIEKSDLKDDYLYYNNLLLDLYEELIDEGVSRKEAIGVVPHSLDIYSMIRINGFNTYHFIGKRKCTEAQWEIRNLAWNIARRLKGVNPTIGKYAEPQCVTYGKCPERNPCPYLEAYEKRMERNLNSSH
ncbi:MAG: FAD-dependent thymidylate synthase [Candidatus Aenigmarchaeota archaeon]|nr:FAD-dependent thymidylate synthase [Candidatus Aenigmarchaeota archaeon]